MASFGRGLLVLWLSCGAFVSGMRVPLRGSRAARSASNGKMIPEREDVIRMPRLAVARADGTEHWMVTLDEDGVVGPDGEVVRTSQRKVIFDAGSRFTRVPNDVADAIYSRVPGASYTSVASMGRRLWVLPCDYELNVAFTFAGIPYPVHPLEAVMDDVSGSANASKKPKCTGAFQPMEETGLPYDIVLGTSFLRNVYVSKNAVDDVPTQPIGDPYVQLLPTLNLADAHREFVQQRLGGTGMTDVQTSQIPAGQTVILTRRASSNRRSSLPWIIVGGVVGALVLAFAIAAAGIYVYGKRYRHLHSPPPSPPLESSGVLEIRSSNGKVDLATPPTPPSARSLSFWRDPMERTRYRQAQDGMAAAVPPRKKLSIFRKKSMSAKSTPAKSTTSSKRKTRGFPAVLAFALNLDKPLPDPHANGDDIPEDGAGGFPPRSPGNLPSRPPAAAPNASPLPLAAPVDSPTLGYQFDQPPPIAAVLKESSQPRPVPPPAATVVKGSSRPRPLPRPPAPPQSGSESAGRIPRIQHPATSDTRG